MRNSFNGKPGPQDCLLVPYLVALLLVVANLQLTQPTAAANESEARVIPGWGKTTAPRLDAKFQVEDNSLTIAVTRDGTEGPAKSEEFQAPRVVRSVEGDFAIEANLNIMRELSKRIRVWEVLPTEDRQEVIKESLALLTSEVGISNQMATAGIRAISSAAIESGDHELGISIFDQAIERVTQAGMPRGDTVAIQLKSWREAIRKELALLGTKLELTGKTLSGEPLDWNQYNGKVVLVDFWASWCGPCRAEMPNIMEQYETYHDLGFEVVGICLDREREKAEEYVGSNEIPWPSLFKDDAGWKHPMARKYNISAIPKAILLDRAGNVISISARGESLRRSLYKLMEDAPIEDALAKPE